jgi:hypothetical protein
MDEPEITDYNRILSGVGNAYFSGLSFGELWDAVVLTDNSEDLDVAIDAAIKLKELIEKD